MTGYTVASRLAATAVAAVAGIISYGHIRHVAIGAGEAELSALLLPVGIDGLIIVATLAMLADKRAGLQPRMSARVALGFGIAATVAFNVASAAPTWSARAVAVVPAVSFLLAVEVLARSGRPRTTGVTPVDGVSAADVTRAGSVASTTAVTAVVGEPVTSGNAAKSTETGERKPARTRTPSRRVSTAERVARAVDRSPNATNAELAARLRLSERTVQRYRREMVTTANGHDGPVEVIPNADD